jgi:hypothetical protein
MGLRLLDMEMILRQHLMVTGPPLRDPAAIMEGMALKRAALRQTQKLMTSWLLTGGEEVVALTAC